MNATAIIVGHLHSVEEIDGKGGVFSLVTIKVANQSVKAFWKVLLRGTEAQLKLQHLGVGDLVAVIDNEKFEIWKLNDSGAPCTDYALFGEHTIAPEQPKVMSTRPPHHSITSPKLFPEQK
ncbi:MAG: hypothetical protein EB015_12450 [Methylocystaceae bacterium]|nr:hypothetical protein [Methylocystaceae bacterium]